MSTPSIEDREGSATHLGSTPELELVGQLIGEYVVEGRLGSGAFGTVYKAVHPLIGKAVAIKVDTPTAEGVRVLPAVSAVRGGASVGVAARF